MNVTIIELDSVDRQDGPQLEGTVDKTLFCLDRSQRQATAASVREMTRALRDLALAGTVCKPAFQELAA